MLTKRAAWFTNSLQAELYRLVRRTGGVTTLPLSGDWVQEPDEFNANGIAVTPNGRALLVVNTFTGTLFRVDPGTGEATTVDLGDYVLTNGDGLLVEGRTLYVVQNRLNQVAVFKLNRRGTEGSLVTTLTRSEIRRADHRRRVQGQPLPAERPLRHPTHAGHRVLGDPDRPRALTPNPGNCTQVRS